MYICNYCGRYLKKQYEKCPACGSTSFKQVQSYNEMVIKTPPKDGYKINYKNYNHAKSSHWTWLLSGLIIVLIGAVSIFLFLKDALKNEGFTIPLLIFAGIIIVFLTIKCSKYFKESKRIRKPYDKTIDKLQKLSKTGILIKNLKYEIKPVAHKDDVYSFSGDKVYVIQIRYEFEKGNPHLFQSEPKYLTALGRDDGTADLLIDPDDHSNYFIDFDIY